ncbi:MAG: DEAD/DEAH box helicase family protein, partial [Candidatus Omnitrophota bacterium]
MELRDYQQDAVDAIFDYWDRGLGKNGLVIAPTGSGKSIIIAAFCKKMQQDWPNTRIIVITDSRELIAQNEKTMRAFWKDASTGIHSAGLGKRNTQARILFCSIQTVYKKAFDFEKTDVICVDECFPHDTEIVTDKGIKKIGDIVEKNLDVRVLTHSGQYKRIVGRFKKPIPVAMVCVIHEKGKVECTPNHRILTKRGWIKAEDLIVGDYIYNVNATLYPGATKQSIESKMGENISRAAPYRCDGGTGKEECIFAQDIDQSKSGPDYLGELDGRYGNQLPEQIKQLSEIDNSSQFEAVRVCRLEICHAAEPLCESPEAGKERGIWRHELLFHNTVFTSIGRLFQLGKNGWANKIYSGLVDAYNRSDCYSGLVFGRRFDNTRMSEYQYIDGSCYTRGGGIDPRLVGSGMGDRIENISFQKGISGWNIQKGRCCDNGEDIKRVEICSPDIDVQSSVYDIEIEDDHTYTANGIVVHNCHMISPQATTRYQRFVGDMLKANKNIVVVGFSATPYRMSTGVMYGNKGDLFDGIMYVCEMKKLIKDGWLVPLVSKAGVSKIDLKGVKIQGGEYNSSDLAHAADSEILVPLAVNEIVECGKDRKAWLVFTSGIAHSEHVAKEMRKHGIDCEIVTGDTKSAERDRIVNKFKDGKLRCLINVAVFTKGFDAPRCDLIALLTSTRSTGKFVQICGRGMRPFPGKQDCKLLDFGSNVLLHGMIDDIDPIRTKNIFNVVKAPPPMRECDKCHAIFHAAIVKCPQCGYEKEVGPADPRHGAEAYSGPVLTSQQTPFLVDVKDFWVSRHKKHGKPDSLKVSFFDQMDKEFSMWLSLDSASAYAAEKSRAIIKQFGGKAATVDDALKEHFNWRKVERIRVKP